MSDRLKGVKKVVMPLPEYARSIYEYWDEHKNRKPPEGYDCWMDYWRFLYERKRNVGTDGG
jgi:hypothetical protein